VLLLVTVHRNCGIRTGTGTGKKSKSLFCLLACSVGTGAACRSLSYQYDLMLLELFSLLRKHQKI
jgi:hypothetical protein